MKPTELAAWTIVEVKNNDKFHRGGTDRDDPCIKNNDRFHRGGSDRDYPCIKKNDRFHRGGTDRDFPCIKLEKAVRGAEKKKKEKT
jgi:hypothetical protein